MLLIQKEIALRLVSHASTGRILAKLGEPDILEILQKRIKPQKGLDSDHLDWADRRGRPGRRPLPAGFHQTRYVTAHGSFTQLVTAEAELAVNAVRTAGDAAA